MTGQGAGKGDRYRPVDQKKYDEGWEAAFGDKSKKKKKKQAIAMEQSPKKSPKKSQKKGKCP